MPCTFAPLCALSGVEDVLRTLDRYNADRPA